MIRVASLPKGPTGKSFGLVFSKFVTLNDGTIVRSEFVLPEATLQPNRLRYEIEWMNAGIKKAIYTKGGRHDQFVAEELLQWWRGFPKCI